MKNSNYTPKGSFCFQKYSSKFNCSCIFNIKQNPYRSKCLSLHSFVPLSSSYLTNEVNLIFSSPTLFAENFNPETVIKIHNAMWCGFVEWIFSMISFKDVVLSPVIHLKNFTYKPGVQSCKYAIFDVPNRKNYKGILIPFLSFIIRKLNFRACQ